MNNKKNHYKNRDVERTRYLFDNELNLERKIVQFLNGKIDIKNLQEEKEEGRPAFQRVAADLK